MTEVELILASRSPRREQILTMLGFRFRAEAPDYEEIIPSGMESGKAPEYLARGKAVSLPGVGAETLVLSADTVVILGDTLLGKPDGTEQALEMLRALNGRTHQVVTGVALAKGGRIVDSGSVVTDVTFADSSLQALKAYAVSEEPKDKAGAYAIQGHGARLVDHVRGCFYNVMGLPIQLTLRMLAPYLELGET